MRTSQRFQVSRVCVVTLLVAGLTGCVAQSPTSSATQATADPATAASASPNAKAPVASTGEAEGSSERSGQAAASDAGAASSASASLKPSKVSGKDHKPPKTWPKKSRKTEFKENAVTDGFIQKTAQMTSPNFGKKMLSEEAPIPTPPDYTGIAMGAALGELEAQFTEYVTNNWQQSGEISIVGEPKVEDLMIDDVLTHRVYMCLDSSDIQVTESDGFVVTAKTKPGTRTAVNIYDLQEHDGELLVVDHLFPEDPNC